MESPKPSISIPPNSSFPPLTHLLKEQRIIRPIPSPNTNSRIPDNVAQHPRLDIALDDHDAVIVLQRRRDQRARLIQAEAAWVHASGGGRLHEGQEARGGVDGVADQRVRGDGGRVGPVEVGDGEEAFAAGGDDEEVLVGLYFLLVYVGTRIVIIEDIRKQPSRQPSSPWGQSPWVRGC